MVDRGDYLCCDGKLTQNPKSGLTCPCLQSYRTYHDGVHAPSRKQNVQKISQILDEKVQSGDLIYDAAQGKTANRLTALQKALMDYDNQPIIDRAELMLSKQNNSQKEENTNEQNDTNEENNDEEKVVMVPRGLFIHGDVGSGKSFLMDLFFENVTVGRKRRVHFHSFMQYIHQQIHQLKQKDLATKGRNFSIDTSLEMNPIHRVAKQLSSEVTLLCFDEFQVTDVADALMLSQLFSILFSRGTVVVATSNRHPSTLYEGGLNRSYFLPFIDLLCRHCIVHDMNTSTDYRSVTTEGIESFFFNQTCQKELKKYHTLMQKLVDNKSSFEEQVIDVAFNRVLKVMAHPNGDLVKFHFDELCKAELGASDYRAIAQQFNTIVIDHIPQLTLKEHDQARRFITLVDELYEANCALMCCAVAHPDKLFVAKRLVDNAEVVVDSVETDVGETLGIDAAQSNGVAVRELASVQELSFAFRRAASRLREMSSIIQWQKLKIID